VKVLCICGPTGVGKSSFAIEVAKALDGEIVSGDAIAIYKQLNIGAAKVPLVQREGIPHYLIDICDLQDEYDVSQFQKDARARLNDIARRGKLPILVGGSGLYLKAVLYDYEFVENNQSPDPAYQSMDNEQLYSKLQELDPSTAAKLHVHNRRRVLRALSSAQSGVLLSEVQAKQEHKPVYDVMFVSLTTKRSLLWERIEQRVDAMLDAGLKEEVAQILKNDPDAFSRRGMQGIGYREWRGYFSGVLDLEEVRTAIITHTRQFLKRQMTWLRHQFECTWVDILESNWQSETLDKIENWYEGTK